MSQKNPALGLLGIAKLSGNVKSGETQVLEAIRDNSAKLVIAAGDASDGTKKKFSDKCAYYNVPIAIALTKAELAHAIGRDYVAIAAVTESGLAGKLSDIFLGGK